MVWATFFTHTYSALSRIFLKTLVNIFYNISINWLQISYKVLRAIFLALVSSVRNTCWAFHLLPFQLLVISSLALPAPFPSCIHLFAISYCIISSPSSVHEPSWSHCSPLVPSVAPCCYFVIQLRCGFACFPVIMNSITIPFSSLHFWFCRNMT